MLREACRQARQWQLDGQPFLRIAVNISPIHFRQPNVLDVVRSALSDHELEARVLEFELTETTVMDHAETSVQILEELSRMGVIVSIADKLYRGRIHSPLEVSLRGSASPRVMGNGWP